MSTRMAGGEWDQVDANRLVFDPTRYNTWGVGLYVAKVFVVAGMVDCETNGDVPGVIGGSYALIALCGLELRPSGGSWVLD